MVTATPFFRSDKQHNHAHYAHTQVNNPQMPASIVVPHVYYIWHALRADTCIQPAGKVQLQCVAMAHMLLRMCNVDLRLHVAWAFDQALLGNAC